MHELFLLLKVDLRLLPLFKLNLFFLHMNLKLKGFANDECMDKEELKQF